VWVCPDVLPDSVQFLVIADDALVVVALPNFIAGRIKCLVDFSRADRFEILDDGIE
jgi:hypothetical protein